MLHPAANTHPKATHQWLLMGVQACRLPALKPFKPFKRLKPLKRLLAMLHPAANSHPKATHQWLVMGVQACRLPALKPLKPFKRVKPLKTLKPLKRLLGMLHPAANSHPKATHQWLQWLLMGRLNNPLACFILQPTGTPRPDINGFLWASKPAVCQLKTLKNLKTLKTLTWHASSCSQQAPQGHTSMASYGPLKQSLGMLHPAANRHPKATHQWLLMGVQPCRLPALKPLKPFKRLKTLKNIKTLKTLTWHASSCSQQPPQGHTSMASYGPLKQSLGMLHPAANRHPKATHQWLLLGVQACRLPALKPLKPFKRLKPLKTLKPLKRLLGMLHPAANSHPKATHQWLLMGVQAYRLPALKPLKPFKRLKPLKTLKPLKRLLGMLHPAAKSHPKATHQWLLLGRCNNPLACFILPPTGTPRLHINGFLWASNLAVCQPLNP